MFGMDLSSVQNYLQYFISNIIRRQRQLCFEFELFWCSPHFSLSLFIHIKNSTFFWCQNAPWEREREREEGNRNLECKHGYHMAVELHNKNREKMGVKEWTVGFLCKHLKAKCKTIVKTFYSMTLVFYSIMTTKCIK